MYAPYLHHYIIVCIAVCFRRKGKNYYVAVQHKPLVNNYNPLTDLKENHKPPTELKENFVPQKTTVNNQNPLNELMKNNVQEKTTVNNDILTEVKENQEPKRKKVSVIL